MDWLRESEKSFFPERGIGRWLFLLVIFASALGVRLYNADAPPLDFYPVRQYRAANLARAFYYESSPHVVSDEVRLQALAVKPPPLEPPITETIASFLYRAFGGEDLIIPRLLSIVCWMVAAMFLYLLATDMISPDAGIASLMFFLFLPLGVVASRSFQPDPLMIMFFMITVFLIFKYYRSPSSYGLVAASIFSATAILIKPICLFPILSVFISIRIPQKNIWNNLFGRDLAIFLAASLLPSLIYYGYGIYIAGFLKHQADKSFIPMLILEPYYWLNWYYNIVSVIGVWAFFLAPIGILLNSSAFNRSLLFGLWVGYLILGLVFTYHIYTHIYYHLILIPIVALSLGQFASIILRGLTINKGIWRISVLAILVSFILYSSYKSLKLTNDSCFPALIRSFEEIGDMVNHSMNTIYLDGHYGDRLMYYSRINGIDWPTNELQEPDKNKPAPLRGNELLEKTISEMSPDYFIISTVDLLKEQEDLKNALDSKYPVIAEFRTPPETDIGSCGTILRASIPFVPSAESPDYIIYDLRHEKSADVMDE